MKEPPPEFFRPFEGSYIKTWFGKSDAWLVFAEPEFLLQMALSCYHLYRFHNDPEFQSLAHKLYSEIDERLKYGARLDRR
jgi:hypothetical protein